MRRHAEEHLDGPFAMVFSIIDRMAFPPGKPRDIQNIPAGITPIGDKLWPHVRVTNIFHTMMVHRGEFQVAIDIAASAEIQNEVRDQTAAFLREHPRFEKDDEERDKHNVKRQSEQQDNADDAEAASEDHRNAADSDFQYSSDSESEDESSSESSGGGGESDSKREPEPAPKRRRKTSCSATATKASVVEVHDSDEER